MEQGWGLNFKHDNDCSVIPSLDTLIPHSKWGFFVQFSIMNSPKELKGAIGVRVSTEWEEKALEN